MSCTNTQSPTVWRTQIIYTSVHWCPKRTDDQLSQGAATSDCYYSGPQCASLPRSLLKELPRVCLVKILVHQSCFKSSWFVSKQHRNTKAKVTFAPHIYACSLGIDTGLFKPVDFQLTAPVQTIKVKFSVFEKRRSIGMRPDWALHCAPLEIISQHLRLVALSHLCIK